MVDGLFSFRHLVSLEMTSTEETHLYVTHRAGGFHLLSAVNLLSDCLPADTGVLDLSKQIAESVTVVGF